MINTEELTKNLDETALTEFNRLWGMRDKLSGVNEATVPILAQYCSVYSIVRKITANMSAGDYDGAWDKNMSRLDKLNKTLMMYVKVLKLSEAAVESNNKFAKLLLK